MSNHRGLGLAVVLALAFGVATAASASAEDRAYKCEAVSSGALFSDAHCLTATGSGSGFKHTLLPESFTAITVTNAKTASSTTAAAPIVLTGHIAGVAVSVRCTAASGSGELHNTVSTASGFITLELTGCTVIVPANKGCKIVGGTINTKPLFFSTSGTTGTTIFVQGLFSSVLAEEIFIEGCEKERPPKAKYFLEGTFEAPVSGATVVLSHANITTQGNLLFGGTVAGIEGALTISAGSSGVTLTP